MPDQLTRLPTGLSLNEQNTLMGKCAVPSPFKYHTFFNDFDTYSSGNWTERNVAGSTLTNAVALTNVNGDGGVLAFILAVTPNNETGITNAQEGFQFATNKELFFETRLNYSNSTGGTIRAGLMQASSTTFFTVNGVYFRKDAADTNLDFVVATSTASTVATLAITTLTTNYNTLGFHYKPNAGIDIYVNDVLIRNISNPVVPLTELAPTLGIRNGSTGAGAAQQLNVDYIFAAKER